MVDTHDADANDRTDDRGIRRIGMSDMVENDPRTDGGHSGGDRSTASTSTASAAASAAVSVVRVSGRLDVRRLTTDDPGF